MKVAIGCDHGGFALKEAVRAYLEQNHIDYKDFGAYSEESVDYAPIAAQAARYVASGQADRGVLICSTGIGISIAANKVKGIRAALCTNEFCAEMTRRHNDANILCMGGKVVDPETGSSEVWLEELPGNRPAALCADDDGNLYYLTVEGIYRLAAGGTLPELVMDGAGTHTREIASLELNSPFEVGIGSVAMDRTADGSFLVSAGADLTDLYDLFSIKGDCDASTVSGWVIDQLGRLPLVGDHFQAEGLDVTVTKVDHRRVVEVRVAVLEPSAPVEHTPA